MDSGSPDASVGHKRRRDEPEVNAREDSMPPKRTAVPPTLTYRLLCPLARCGNLLGKGGETIKRIRRDTGCRLRIEDIVRNADERIVTIGSSELELHPEQPSPAEDALLTVQSLIAGSPPDHGHHETVARLLVDTAHTGSIMGKGGSIISTTRRESGASIRLMNGNKRPPCARDQEELIEIKGTRGAVRRALERIAAQLRGKMLQKPQAPVITIRADATGGNLRVTTPDPMLIDTVALSGPLPTLPPGFGGGLRLGALPPPPPICVSSEVDAPARVEVTFQLLVPTNLIGMVLGRNGDIVKQIRAETGARVKVGGELCGEPERIVTISSVDEASSNDSAAAQALLRCCAHILPSDKPLNCHNIRLLIPSSQVGPLMGRNNSLAEQLHADTGADVRILPAGRRPGDDEVAQVTGIPEACLNAVARVAATLREAQTRQTSPARTPQEDGTPPSVTLRRPTQFSNRPAFAPPPRRGGYDSDPGPPVRPGPPHRGPVPARRPPPTRFRDSDDRRPEHRRLSMLRRDSLDGSPRSLDSRSSGGFTGPNRPDHAPPPGDRLTLILSAKQAGCIIGKGGTHISQIRQISGARVKLFENPAPNGERRLDIIGVKSQIMSAENLIQGFLLAADVEPLRNVRQDRR